MVSLTSLALLCVASVCVFADPALGEWREYQDAIMNLAIREDVDEMLEEHVKIFAGGNDPALLSNFQCDVTPSNQVPTSVHRLTAGDIQVVAALGDSLTAANGANAAGVVRVLREYRGFSWSVGGYKDYESGITTLPNILKKYGSDLKGFSTATGNVNSAGAGLNVAEPGHKALNMPQQARNLVTKMRSWTDINMSEDWKMVTLFIGGNDLCDYCKDKSKYSPANYIRHIKEALDILYENLPRTIVNLVSIFDITPVANIGKNVICKTIHFAICNCARKEANADMLLQVSQDYSREAENLVASGRYDTRDDFTVVFQPFWAESPIPTLENGEPDYSYFSPDCFHFAAKGHAAAAVMLWNGMFEPVGLKSRAIRFDATIQCPAAGTFIPTAKNSK